MGREEVTAQNSNLGTKHLFKTIQLRVEAFLYRFVYCNSLMNVFEHPDFM